MFTVSSSKISGQVYLWFNVTLKKVLIFFKKLHFLSTFKQYFLVSSPGIFDTFHVPKRFGTFSNTICPGLPGSADLKADGLQWSLCSIHVIFCVLVLFCEADPVWEVVRPYKSNSTQS